MLTTIVLLMYLLIILTIITLIFIERRSVYSTICWVLALVFLPFLGVFLYILFGRRFLKDKKLRLKKNEDSLLRDMLMHSSALSDSSDIPPILDKHSDMVTMFGALGTNPISHGNDVELFFESNDFFKNLLTSLDAAKKSICIQFYIFKDDEIGKKIINILEQKQLSGVSVKVMYDAMGSRNLNRSSFNRLVSLGGEVTEFLPSVFKIINLNLNYRNHRKIVIIDGEGGYDVSPIGFVGGYNVGDEYLGKYKKFGKWRDTHLAVKGPAIRLLSIRFFLDWRFATRREIDVSKYLCDDIPKCGDVSMQIVSSGPDILKEEIKMGYLKMIHSAKEYIYIQSPYLILDSSLSEALKMASYRGVNVSVMIPSKPDHPFVYWASLSYAGELLESGANIYCYDRSAFLHSKTLVIDDEICSIGTANMDIRSFSLNFEINSFMYSKKIAIEQRKQFELDAINSTHVTNEIYAHRCKTIRFKESISRLFSPIL